MTIDKDTITALHAVLLAKARDICKDAEHESILLGFSEGKDGALCCELTGPLPMIQGMKDKAALVLRMTADAYGVAVHLTEAYAVYVERNGRTDEEMKALSEQTPPSEHPDRVEVLVITMTGRDGWLASSTHKITVNADGTRTLSDSPLLWDGQDGLAMGGTMPDIMRPPRTLN